MFRRNLVVAAAGLVLAAAGAFVVPSAAYDRPGHYTQVDVTATGQSANGTAPETSLSGDGRYVAFSSTATNLGAPGAAQSNVYVRDLRTRRIELISRGADGKPAVPGAAPTCPNPGSGGLASGIGSDNPVISATGRYVAFASSDVNLISGGTAANANVYVYDRQARVMRIASVGASGEPAKGWSCNPSISDDGRRVAFISNATNLVSDANGTFGVYVHDFTTRKTVRADVSSAGAPAQQTCSTGVPVQVAALPSACVQHRPAAYISGNGRYVAFDSLASNLVPADTDNSIDVFRHDLTTGATIRISVTSDGSQQVVQPTAQDGIDPDDVGSFLTSPYCDYEIHRGISADGRYVLFRSRADNLVPTEANKSPVAAGVGVDAYVRDIAGSRTYRVDVGSDGAERPGAFCSLSLSSGGRFVAMDSGGEWGVHDRITGAFTELQMQIGLNAAGTKGYSAYVVQDISADGRYVSVVMFDRANNAQNFNAFVWDRGPVLGVGGTGGTAPAPSGQPCAGVSVGSTCLPPNSALTGAAISAGDCAVRGRPELLAASVAYRPRSGDLFVRLDYDPRTRLAAGELMGVDLVVGSRHYEVRAAPTDIALFGQTAAGWARVTGLAGAIGTTGTQVVFVAPLRTLGLTSDRRIRSAVAFAALGSAPTGAICRLAVLKVG